MPVSLLILLVLIVFLFDSLTLSSSSGLLRLLSESILLMGVRMPVEHMPERAILLLILVDLFLLFLMMLLDNCNFLVSFLLMVVLFVSLGASSVIIVSMMSVSESILTFGSCLLLVANDDGLLLGNLLTDFTLRLLDFDSKDVYYGFGRRSMAFDTWHAFFELSLLGELVFDPANNSTIFFLKCILFFIFVSWLLSVVLLEFFLIRAFVVLSLLLLVKLCFLFLFLVLPHFLG